MIVLSWSRKCLHIGKVIHENRHPKMSTNRKSFFLLIGKTDFFLYIDTFFLLVDIGLNKGVVVNTMFAALLLGIK
jgi:hypothetical protein